MAMATIQRSAPWSPNAPTPPPPKQYRNADGPGGAPINYGPSRGTDPFANGAAPYGTSPYYGRQNSNTPMPWAGPPSQQGQHVPQYTPDSADPRNAGYFVPDPTAADEAARIANNAKLDAANQKTRAAWDAGHSNFSGTVAPSSPIGYSHGPGRPDYPPTSPNPLPGMPPVAGQSNSSGGGHWTGGGSTAEGFSPQGTWTPYTAQEQAAQAYKAAHFPQGNPNPANQLMPPNQWQQMQAQFGTPSTNSSMGGQLQNALGNYNFNAGAPGPGGYSQAQLQQMTGGGNMSSGISDLMFRAQPGSQYSPSGGRTAPWQPFNPPPGRPTTGPVSTPIDPRQFPGPGGGAPQFDPNLMNTFGLNQGGLNYDNFFQGGYGNGQGYTPGGMLGFPGYQNFGGPNQNTGYY